MWENVKKFKEMSAAAINTRINLFSLLILIDRLKKYPKNKNPTLRKGTR